MARSSETDLKIQIPDPSRQIAFQELLATARKVWLIDALIEALGEADPELLRQQQQEFVPADVHVLLAAAGIPDEHVFPLPVLLEHKPTLVAYYRLLLGVSQKSFYGTGTGMGQFRSMEEAGNLSDHQRASLSAFCRAMCPALADLVRETTPSFSRRDVAELPLLTLGQKFQGANNNTIGQQATRAVFLAVEEALEHHTTAVSRNRITVHNPHDQEFVLILTGDPDIRIQEVQGKELINRVAIEIKGGSDRSNQHNRIGEAEKSHQKARDDGYEDFWTIIRTAPLDMDVAALESPTTRLWFDTAQVGSRQGTDWERLRHHLWQVLALPASDIVT